MSEFLIFAILAYRFKQGEEVHVESRTYGKFQARIDQITDTVVILKVIEPKTIYAENLGHSRMGHATSPCFIHGSPRTTGSNLQEAKQLISPALYVNFVRSFVLIFSQKGS